MKLVYTHANPFHVYNAKNIIEEQGIETLLKNEYAGGAAGDLAPIDTWLELWVTHDGHCELAKNLIEQAFTEKPSDKWQCPNCNEINEASFDSCWSCQTNRF